MKKVCHSIILFCSSLFFIACKSPFTPPKFYSVEHNEGFSIYKSHKPIIRNYSPIVEHPQPREVKRKNKNLLLIISDEIFNDEVSGVLAKKFPGKRSLSIDELTWNYYGNSLQKIYDEVVLIYKDNTRFKNIKKALDYMESREKNYDFFILSHGFPEHLSSGTRGYFLSYKEINNFQLEYLDLVFMQACFGAELADNWKIAGAKEVIAFDSLTNSFFYIRFFIEAYRTEIAFKAYERAAKKFINRNNYSNLEKTLIKEMNLIEDLEKSPSPIFYSFF